jgi:hypothetical protein
MKINKLIPVLALAISCNAMGQKTPKSPKSSSPNTVNLELLEEIQRSNSIGASLRPLDMAGSGNFMLMGVGMSVDAINIFDKVHFYGDFNYNYGKYNFSENLEEYRSYDYASKHANSMEAILGITLSEKTEKVEKRITIGQKGNTDYVTDLKDKQIITNVFRIGYKNQGQFMTGELDTYINQSKYSMFSAQNNIVIGFNRITSSRSKFKTNLFGNAFNFSQNTWYFDAMIAMPSKFPYVDLITRNSYNTEDIANFVSIDNQNVFRSSFKKMPLGIRVGYKNNDTPLKNGKIRYQYIIEAGTYSGYYRASSFGIGGLFYAKLGLSIGFLKSL